MHGEGEGEVEGKGKGKGKGRRASIECVIAMLYLCENSIETSCGLYLGSEHPGGEFVGQVLGRISVIRFYRMGFCVVSRKYVSIGWEGKGKDGFLGVSRKYVSIGWAQNFHAWCAEPESAE